jgi:hypothetical protein
MNRLFIILGALALVGTAAWALLHESPPPKPKPTAPVETPDCCQPAPSRSTMLQKK